MMVSSLVACCLLLTSASAASIPSPAVDVILSGDFSRQLQDGTCNLPDVINVTITAGDVIISSVASKTQRVTQDAPVYVIGDDGLVRPVANKDEQTYALYQDTSTGSALLVTCPMAESQEKPTVEGTVTYKGRQFHLCHSSRRRRDVSSVTSESDEYQLTEVPEDPVKGQTIDYVLPPEFDSLHNFPSGSIPEKEQADALDDDFIHRLVRRQTMAMRNIYIDTTVVIAFDIYESYYNDSRGTTLEQKQAETMEEIKRHYALLMSEVDLHYGMIGSRLPYKISIGLASFVIAQSAVSSKWTETFKKASNESDRYVVDSSAALENFKSWIVNTTSLPSMDYHILFTGYDLSLNGSTTYIGLAYRNGVCASDEILTASPGRNSAVVEDQTHYFSQTVLTATHEIGHGLGAPHDGDGNDCLESASYIMSPTEPEQNATNYGIFSPCSLAYFNSAFSRLSLSRQSESCIHEITSPAGVPNVTGLVPGQVYDVQTQCKRALGNESLVCQSLTSIGDSMCTETYCDNPQRPGYCRPISLLRGTTCGDKKWCVNAFCVSSANAGSMDESCPFGNRYVWRFPDSNKTCGEYATEQSWRCYGESFRNLCCESCNEVKRQNSESCPFGNRYVRPFSNSNKTCGEYATEQSWRCYGESFRNSCCESCNEVKRQNSESCPFGDRIVKPYSNVNGTCAELATEDPSECYDDYFQSACCKSCNDVKRENSGCPYGDRSYTCRASYCNNPSLWETCCSTCSAYITTTATTTTRATTTTPWTTTTSTTTTPATTTTTTTPRTTTPTTTMTTTTPRTTTPATTTTTTTTPRTTTPSTTTTTPRTTTPTTTTTTTTTTRTTTPPTTTTTTSRTTTPTTTTTTPRTTTPATSTTTTPRTTTPATTTTTPRTTTPATTTTTPRTTTSATTTTTTPRTTTPATTTTTTPRTTTSATTTTTRTTAPTTTPQTSTTTTTPRTTETSTTPPMFKSRRNSATSMHAVGQTLSQLTTIILALLFLCLLGN